MDTCMQDDDQYKEYRCHDGQLEMLTYDDSQCLSMTDYNMIHRGQWETINGAMGPFKDELYFFDCEYGDMPIYIPNT